ncbi:MAG: hypothetical protein ACW98A_01130 [Candidatus Hodarchaeales archaeon]|jgi:hypothetical protein
MTENQELLVLLLSWDEKSGPIFLDSNPNLDPSVGLKLGVQIYMITSSIFGTEDYSAEIVDIPFSNLGFRSRIWIDFRIDETVRGEKLPFMLAVTYTDPKYKTILSENDDVFSEALSKYCNESKINLKFLREFICDQGLLHYSTLNQFYDIISSVASSSYLGLAAGTIIRAPIVHEIDLDSYFSHLPTTIPQGIVSQVLINEIQEYWYAFWIGPFTFMFQPPINDIHIFSRLIKGISNSIGKLWNLTRTDPTSKVDMVNILTKITYKPALIFQLYQQSCDAASHKLSGKELSAVDRFRNSDVLFYIQSQAQRLVRNNYNSIKISDLLTSYHEYIDGSYWEGFLIVFGFFLGKELFPGLKQKKPINYEIIFEKIINLIYYNKSKWIITVKEKLRFEIFNCPYYKLSKKCNFVRGIVLGVFESDILEFEKNEEQLVLSLKTSSDQLKE